MCSFIFKVSLANLSNKIWAFVTGLLKIHTLWMVNYISTFRTLSLFFFIQYLQKQQFNSKKQKTKNLQIDEMEEVC